jgi:hypothetical protein
MDKGEKKSCSNCVAWPICRVRSYFDCSDSADLVRVVTNSPDGFGNVAEGMRNLIAENCQYFKSV